MKVGKINHIGIVVTDASEAMERYGKLYGIKKWYKLVAGPIDLHYHGEKRNCTVDLYFGGKGKTKIELIETHGEPNIYTTFYINRGEAVHHYQYNVKDLDEAVRECEALGMRVFQYASFDSAGATVRYAYVGTSEDTGAIELIETRVGNRFVKGDVPFEVGFIGVLTGNYKRVK